jgi:hypothetical protein
MGKTFKDSMFKDNSTVKSYSPNLSGGRPSPKQAGYKESKNGIARGSAQGRQETFLKDVPAPKTFGKEKNARLYGK